MPDQRQTVLSCGCGLPATTAAGLCRICARRVRLSRERFGGLREGVLKRDGYQCRGCGELVAASLVVHHRRPGRTAFALLVTLCRRCHVRIHATRRPPASFSMLLLLLWRELHRGWPEQRLLPFFEPAGAEQEQAPLWG